ncbi:MAG: SusC/RagA family TonB-linked outer membrane protein, partial [Bacteroidota bacterium]
GVVLITTKRGKKDGIQISFDSYVSVQSTPKLVNVLNAQQFADIAVEVGKRDTISVLPEWSNPSKLRTIDWQKELYGTGKTQSYNLAIRGGGEKSQAAFSLGYYDQKGIVKSSDFKRFNASLNLDFTPAKWLTAGTSLKYTRTDGSVAFGTGVGGLEMLTKLIPTMTGNPLTDQVKNENGDYGYYTKGATSTSASVNVFANVEDQDRSGGSNRLNSSTYVEVNLLPGLKFKTNAGINVDDNSGFYFQKSNNRQNSFQSAYYSQTASNTFEWLWENTLSYSKTIGIHGLDFVGGISSQENTYRQLFIGGNGVVNDNLRDVGSVDAISGRSGNQVSWSLYSQFARLTYKLMDRYIVTGTLRRDGSSRFPMDKRYGVFPSVSVAWRLKDEAFLANVSAISDLKIRGSWGKTGNQSIDPFTYQGAYTLGPNTQNNRGYVFGPYNNKAYQAGIVLQGQSNPLLTWETSTQSNIGFDAAFLDGKLDFTVDYYNKKSINALANISVPSQTGFDRATRNVGSIQNSGLEFAVNYRVSSGEFKWGVGANVTTVKNQLLSLTDGLDNLPNVSSLNFPTWSATDSWGAFGRSQVGNNVGAFYGFISDGIFQSQTEIAALNAEAERRNGKDIAYQTTKTVAGDRKFKDLNNDGRITDEDRQIIGSPIPDFYGGFNFDASYKNFDFSMLWYASVGNQILNYAKRNLESMASAGGGFQNVSVEYYENRWTEKNPSNTYTRPIFKDVNGSTRVSDYYVEDGSYVRLRNIQVGYTLPSSLIKKASLSRVRFYVSAQNVFTFTKYSGLNPEIGDLSGTDATGNNTRGVTTSGLDIGSYPITRSFTFGLSAQF